MYTFLIKKTFYDMWDNFLAMFLMNVGFVILVCGFFILPSFLGIPGALLPFYMAGGAVVITFYTGGVYRFTLDLADYKKRTLLQFLRGLVGSWKQSLVSSAITLLLIAVILVVLPYYLLSESTLLLVLGGIMFWAWFTVLMAGLFFPPASVRLGKKLLPSLRDSFSFLFDNLPFCLYVLFVFLFTLVVSAIVFFVIPGPATMILWINVCFKIRLYKYEYLQAYPGTNKRDIPWDDLIAGDKELVGKRTLRGLIFPWRQ
jgi:hypothetical protein